MTKFKSAVIIGLGLFVLSVLFLSACKKKQPEGILGQKEMVDILSDLHIIDGYSATVSYVDSVKELKRNFYATIYAKHHVSEAAFQKSFKYYSMQPELLDTIYTQVENIILKKEKRLNRINEAKRKKLLKKK
jgi:hypothetical protein